MTKPIGTPATAPSGRPRGMSSVWGMPLVLEGSA